MAGDLTTESGKRVPALQVCPALFLDRSLVIYGPSKTGKTTLVKMIMKTLSGFVEQALVISPSEPTNRSYEGYIDAPFIHYRLYLADPTNPRRDDGVRGALRFLETVWQRQEMMAAIYTRANSPAVLEGLFGRLPAEVRREAQKHLESLGAARARVAERVRRQYPEGGRREEKAREVKEKFCRLLLLLYKKYITAACAALWEKPDLSEDERYSLSYLDFNPRLLLIFDDCAAQLKPFFSKEIFRKLFYQNRHCFITIIVCAQDDTDLPTNLRKNAFVSFFTEQIVCASNFERPSNKFPKATRQHIESILPDLFRENRKLAYIREDDRRLHFYHVQAPQPRLFRFGSAAAHELCEAVASEGTTMDKENPFYEHFKV